MMRDTQAARPRRRTLVAAVTALALVLQGCSGSGVGGMFNSLAGYDDPSDPCNYARQPLLESGRTFSQSIITGAAIGALGGAAAGATFSRNSAQGAGFGALAGGVLGAMSGYLAAKQEQARTQGELIASIDRDAASDNRSLVSARNAIGTLTRCRRKQVADTDRAYRSHAITAAQAKQELEKVHGQMRADDQLIGEVLGKVGERTQTYVSAKEQAGSGSGRGRRVAARGSQGSTGALQQTERQAQQQQTEHRDVDTGLQKRINDLSATVG